MEVPMIAWLSLVVILAVVLSFDLLVFGRRAHEVSFKEALTWSAVYISLGVAYSFAIQRWLGAQASGEYLAGFVIEKSLSVDNIFVFAVIFTAFGVPAIYRQRALLWGVIGALVLRFIFILFCPVRPWQCQAPCPPNARINRASAGLGSSLRSMPDGSNFELPTGAFALGRGLKGSLMGGARRTDAARFVDWFVEGRFSLDHVVSHRLSHDEINHGFAMMKSGQAVRSVVVY